MRKLLLAAVVVLITGIAIAIICVVNREEDAGAIVMVIFGSVFAILTATALFVGPGPKAAAAGTTQATDESREILRRAHEEASRILSDAADKALALSSLDAGKCRHCGNPRTGKFCPKCGRAVEA